MPAGFKTHYADGKPKTCKFCHAQVWWCTVNNRWYEPGGAEFHVCEKKTAHYKNEAAERSHGQRSKRTNG